MCALRDAVVCALLYGELKANPFFPNPGELGQLGIISTGAEKTLDTAFDSSCVLDAELLGDAVKTIFAAGVLRSGLPLSKGTFARMVLAHERRTLAAHVTRHESRFLDWLASFERKLVVQRVRIQGDEVVDSIAQLARQAEERRLFRSHSGVCCCRWRW